MFTSLDTRMHIGTDILKYIIVLIALVGIGSATITINHPTEGSTVPTSRPILNASFASTVNAIYCVDGTVNETLCTSSTSGERKVLSYRSKFINNEGVLFESFENTAEWTEATDIHDDIDHFKSGVQGICMKINSSTQHMDKTIDYNFANVNNFALYFYIDNLSGMAQSFDGIQIYLSSDDFNSYFYWRLSTWHVVNKWNRVIIHKNNAFICKNPSWGVNMTTIRIETKASSGDKFNITYDDFRLNYSARPKCILTFDDELQGSYDRAFGIMSDNNQTGVAYICISKIDTTIPMEHLNISEIHDLEVAGWDVSGHTINHPDLTRCNASELDHEINGGQQWLIDNGFVDAKRFFTYPFAIYNNNVLNVVKENHTFVTAGTRHGGSQYSFPVFERDSYYEYIIRRNEIRDTTTVQSLKDEINTTIYGDSMIIYLLHDVVDTNPHTYSGLTSDFQEFSDYLASRSTEIDVITMSDLADSYSLPDGDHTITVYADNGESKQVNFTVDTHELIDGVLYYWGEYITDMHSLYAAVNNSSILDYNPNTNEYRAHYTLQQSNPPHIDASSDLFVGHHTLNESPATIPTDADKISGHSITDLMRKILNYIRSAI